MDDKSCKILNMILKNPPENLSWEDLIYLLQQVEHHYNGCLDPPAPRGRIRFTLPIKQSDPSLFWPDNVLDLSYSDVVREAKAEAVADYLTWAGVKPCPGF